MPNDAGPSSSRQDWHTRLSHAGRAGTHAHGFVNLGLADSGFEMSW
jgi:cystathionine beta-lyase